MSYCCVPMCVSRYKKGSGLSFHEIPSNLELREKWIKAIARKDWMPNTNSNYSRVCSMHFKTDDFSESVNKIRRLKPRVVPSIFNRNPNFKDGKARRYRKQLADLEEDDYEEIFSNPTTSSLTAAKDYKTVSIVPSSPNSGFVYDVTVIQGTDNNDTCSTSEFVNGKDEQQEGQSPCLCVQGDHIYSNRNDKEHHDKTTQADFRIFQSFERRRWLRKFRDLKRRLAVMKQKADTHYSELQNLKSDPYVTSVLKLEQMSKEENTSALFLLDQIYNSTLAVPRWTKTTLQQSMAMRNISCTLYEHLQTTKLLKLPGHMTLCKYVENVESSRTKSTN